MLIPNLHNFPDFLLTSRISSVFLFLDFLGLPHCFLEMCGLIESTCVIDSHSCMSRIGLILGVCAAKYLCLLCQSYIYISGSSFLLIIQASLYAQGIPERSHFLQLHVLLIKSTSHSQPFVVFTRYLRS